ncbi:MAG: alkylhydroperoxidase domain protein [Cellulomonas sp.]
MTRAPEQVASIASAAAAAATATATGTDTIDDVLGGAAATVARTRSFRPAVVEHAQANVAALFGPDTVDEEPSLAERLILAREVATLVGENGLADHYTGLLEAAPRDRRVPDARAAALLTHAARLGTSPALAASTDLAGLLEAGWSTTGIITASQVVGFVHFQARTIAGLRLLAASHGASDGGGDPAADDASGPRAHRVTAVEPARRDGRPFTQEHLDWTPWLEPITLADADDEQRAALTGFRGEMPYFLLLARDARALARRTSLDDAIFFGRGGLPRAERELAATVASRVNGCVFCASVHSAKASSLSGRGDDVQRLLDDGVGVSLDARWDAVVDLAAALSTTPVSADVAYVHRVRAAGLSDEEILDVVQAAAFFAWANRLMLSLGEPAPVG